MIAKLKMILTKFKSEEDGSVLVLVAAALVALLGMTAMVVDVGALTLERSRLVNACDAAALAAARELPDTTVASQKAYEYLQYNDVPTANTSINFNADNTKITVAATRTVNYTFARVLGLNSGTVNAQAAAAYGGISSTTGVVPFGIPEQQLEFGQECQLKAGSNDDYGPGNYGALMLELTGAKSYKNYIKDGYDGVISVGDWVETEPGNMSGPTEDGVNHRLGECTHSPHCTIEHYDSNCARIIIVPIYEPTPLSGRDKVHIIGFGVFLLKEVGGSGNDSYVSGYFLQTVPPEGIDYDIDPNQTDYGMHATRLLE